MFSNIFRNAKATIKGSKEFSKINGTVTFKETKDGVLMTAKIIGLPRSTKRCKRKIFWISYT